MLGWLSPGVAANVKLDGCGISAESHRSHARSWSLRIESGCSLSLFFADYTGPENVFSRMFVD